MAEMTEAQKADFLRQLSPEEADEVYYRTHIEGRNPITRLNWWAYNNPVASTIAAKAAFGAWGARHAYKKWMNRNTAETQLRRRRKQRRRRSRRTSRASKRKR